MEWFDYDVFTSGTITGVIGRVFFPGDSNAVLKSLALVAVSSSSARSAERCCGVIGGQFRSRRASAGHSLTALRARRWASGGIGRSPMIG